MFSINLLHMTCCNNTGYFLLDPHQGPYHALPAVYSVCLSGWAVIALLWHIGAFYLYKDSSVIICKAVATLPLVKVAVLVIGTAFWTTCEDWTMCSFWLGVSLINTHLVYETGLMVCFLLIAKGRKPSPSCAHYICYVATTISLFHGPWRRLVCGTYCLDCHILTVSTLYCTVLDCTLLYCTVLNCTILYLLRLEHHAGELHPQRVARHRCLHVCLLYVQLHHSGAGGVCTEPAGVLGGMYATLRHHVCVYCAQCGHPAHDSAGTGG